MNSEKTVSIYTQIEDIPSHPGVYKFYDSEDNLLYVGKAINLKSRVSSYFSSTHFDRPNIIPMIDQIVEIKHTVTDNEVEALVLETALIKKYQPKFNIRSKDDKSDAWIYISTRDELPTVKIVRSIDRKEYKRGRLFGPYPNSKATRQIFKYIRKAHPFCTCRDPKEPCLYYHLGLCINPKFGEFTKEEYLHEIEQIIKFLKGNKKREISRMEKEMIQLSNEKKYEEAAALRDKIYDLKHLGRRQNWYEDEHEFERKRIKNIQLDLEKLGKDIDTDKGINRIECYDISNLQGKNAFGSMVVFDNFKINNSLFRIFKIKEKDTPDDYSMLNEVIKRRIQHLEKTGNDSLNSMPDIILIDGGKGQVNAVKDLIPQEIILMGISKGRSQKKKGKRSKDEFWLLRDGEVESVKIRSPKYLIRLRDEAHRFSLKYHRKLRLKSEKVSLLDSVEGIGPRRKKELKREFGTVKNMKEKSLEQLNTVIKNKKISARLYKRLRE